MPESSKAEDTPEAAVEVVEECGAGYPKSRADLLSNGSSSIRVAAASSVAFHT